MSWRYFHSTVESIGVHGSTIKGRTRLVDEDLESSGEGAPLSPPSCPPLFGRRPFTEEAWEDRDTARTTAKVKKTEVESFIVLVDLS